jgi:hypothetical protein
VVFILLCSAVFFRFLCHAESLLFFGIEKQVGRVIIGTWFLSLRPAVFTSTVLPSGQNARTSRKQLVYEPFLFCTKKEKSFPVITGKLIKFNKKCR